MARFSRWVRSGLKAGVVLILIGMLTVSAFLITLRLNPAFFLPSSLARLVRGGSASYNLFTGDFSLRGLLLEDEKNRFLLDLPLLRMVLYPVDLLEFSPLRIREVSFEKPQITFINLDTPVRPERTVIIHEGIGKYIQKNFLDLILEHVRISGGSLDFIDHPGRLKDTITHKVRDLDLEAFECRIRIPGHCELRLFFSLSTDLLQVGNQKGAEAVFAAHLYPDPGEADTFAFDFVSQKPLPLRIYDLYLGSRGYRILSGWATLAGKRKLDEGGIQYENRVRIGKLGLEDRRDTTRSKLRNLFLDSYLDFISDEDGTISTVSRGQVSFDKGTKAALRTIKGNLLKAVEGRLQDW